MLAWHNTAAKHAVIHSGEAEKASIAILHLQLVQDAADLGSGFNHDHAWQQWPPGNVARNPELVRSDILYANGIGIHIIHPRHTVNLSHVTGLGQHAVKFIGLETMRAQVDV